MKKSVFFYNEKGIKAGKSNDDILSDERLKNLYEEERPRYECLKKYIGFLIGEMCIRDRYKGDFEVGDVIKIAEQYYVAVSYTHLDVYNRQDAAP